MGMLQQANPDHEQRQRSHSRVVWHLHESQGLCRKCQVHDPDLQARLVRTQLDQHRNVLMQGSEDRVLH